MELTNIFLKPRRSMTKYGPKSQIRCAAANVRIVGFARPILISTGRSPPHIGLCGIGASNIFFLLFLDRPARRGRGKEVVYLVTSRVPTRRKLKTLLLYQDKQLSLLLMELHLLCSPFLFPKHKSWSLWGTGEIMFDGSMFVPSRKWRRPRSRWPLFQMT